MSEVVRDAVVRLRLEQKAQAIKAPDLSPLLAQREREKQLIDETIAAAAQQKAAEVERVNTVVAKIREMEQANIKARQAAEQAAESSRQAMEQVRDGAAAALGATQQVGEGFFLLARSAAIMGAVGEENLKLMLDNILRVQAAFDAFKGTVQIIQGVIAGMKALTAAKLAAAAASGFHTAALAAEAGMMGIAGTAAVALQIALGPVGIALAAIAATVAIVIWAYNKFTQESREAEAAQKALAEETERNNAILLKQTQLETKAIARRQQMADKISNLATKEQQLAEVRKKNQDAAARLATIDKEIKGAGSAAGSAQELANLERIKAERAAIISDLERQRGLEDSINQKAEQRRNALKQEIEIRKRAVDLAREALKSEQERTQGIRAQIGALSKREKADLARLTQKVESGANLTDRELKRFAAQGGESAQKFAREQFAKRDEGLSDRVSRATTGKGLDEAAASKQAAIDTAQGKLSESTGGATAEEALERLKQSGDKMTAGFETFLEKNTALLTKAVSSIEAVDNRIDEVEVAQEGSP